MWKGKTQGPRGWVELIDKRDPACPVHSELLAFDERQADA